MTTEDTQAPPRRASRLPGYRRHALANIELGRAGVLRVRPEAIWMPVSENCNLACIGCYDVVRGFDKVYLSPDEARRLLGTAAGGAGYKEIDLTGAEALLHPQLAEVIDVCRELHPQAAISLITNGTVPVRGKYREAYARLDAIGLSIDGATPETFESIRVGARLDRFIQCAKDLVALREATGRPRSIQFCFTACSLNLHELPDVIRLARQLNVESVFAQTMDMNMPEVRRRIGHLHLDLMDAAERRRLVDQARAVAAEVGVRFAQAGGLYPPAPDVGGPSAEFRRKAAALGVGVADASQSDAVRESVRLCQYPWTQAPAIKKTARGWRLLMCCNMTDAVNEELQQRYGIDDIRERSILDLVNSPGYWQFREDLVEGRLHDACGQCSAAKTYALVGHRPLVMAIDALSSTRNLAFPGGAALREALMAPSAAARELRLLERAIRRDWLDGQAQVPDWLAGVMARLPGGAS